eukprot:CAMPEP_0176071882 /NCGR_PEP_ID=MMETSP0120_2-20121206/35905_1 /TAXON_ID=160619 /ORGANISM="Kryptoperidinium foliaceum, Strain CCMP 1326" /LENGTH=175 /DNA_ID=CAMNT_0017405543 /DNA_START=8 /DNA_END=533 /DNA_ORIENTATION=+
MAGADCLDRTAATAEPIGDASPSCCSQKSVRFDLEAVTVLEVSYSPRVVIPRKADAPVGEQFNDLAELLQGRGLERAPVKLDRGDAVSITTMAAAVLLKLCCKVPRPVSRDYPAPDLSLHPALCGLQASSAGSAATGSSAQGHGERRAMVALRVAAYQTNSFGCVQGASSRRPLL